jgi:hypothetical protein
MSDASERSEQELRVGPSRLKISSPLYPEISNEAPLVGDCARMTLVLYRRRACTNNKVEVSRAFRRAFDKAVRTKPPAVAADAGLCKFNGGKVWCGDAPELCDRAQQTTRGEERVT